MPTKKAYPSFWKLTPADRQERLNTLIKECKLPGNLSKYENGGLSNNHLIEYLGDKDLPEKITKRTLVNAIVQRGLDTHEVTGPLKREENKVSKAIEDLAKKIYPNDTSFVNILKKNENLLKSVKVFYTKGDNLTKVKDICQTQGDGRIGAYIATYTPFIRGRDTYHVINCVICDLFPGSIESKYFSSLQSTKRITELVKIYKNIFKKIYRCAHEKKLTTVVMPIIGGEWDAVGYQYEQIDKKNADIYKYAKNYMQGDFNIEHGYRAASFQLHIWTHAFRCVWEEAENQNLTTILVSEFPTNIAITELGKTFKGLFHSKLKDVNYSEKNLYVNAVLPGDLPGDHPVDASFSYIDTFFSNTTIPLTVSTATNPYIRFEAV